MYCSKCGNKVQELPERIERVVNKNKASADYDQEVYAAAHRMYRDWQRSRKQMEEAKLRDIAREVYHAMNQTLSTAKVTSNKIPNRAGLPWTLPEDNILRDELCLFIKATAQDHARTYNTVSARLIKLYIDAAR
jgi:ribosome-binding ATPase YchF (GTP1/OBG family)